MKIPPRLALLSLIVAIGWASPIFRLAAAPPLLAAGVRLLFAAVLLFPFCIGGAIAAFREHRPNGLPALAAGVLLAAHFAAWVPSLALTSVAASTLLVATQPLYSAAMESFFLKESLHRRTILGIAAAFLGICVIFSTEFQTDGARHINFSARHVAGGLLAVLGAVFGAAQFVVSRGARRRMPVGSYILVVNAVAAVCLLSASLATGEPWFGATESYPDWRGVDSPAVLWFLLLALGPQLLGHGAANVAVRSYPATIVNAALLSEPVVASILAWVLFGELPRHPVQFAAGGSIVLAGVLTALSKSSPDPASH
jgi:drug/metabolite transporter (DMT)-like permease